MSFSHTSKQAVPNDFRSGRQAVSQAGSQASPLRWRPHVLTRLLRRRSVYWTLAVGLILLTIGVTYSQNSRASSIISSLGEQQDVLVAVRDLERGEAIARDDFRIEQRPAGFVPLDALKWSAESAGTGRLAEADGSVNAVSFADGSSSPDTGSFTDAGASWERGADWINQVALEPIYEGEILVSGRVGSGEDLPIPPGTSAIAVPTSENRLSLNRGDRVDLLRSLPDGPTGEVPVLRVAQNAFVVETAERSTTVAVQSAELPGVVRGLTHGVVTIVLRG